MMPSGAYLLADAATLEGLKRASAGRQPLDLNEISLSVDGDVPAEVTSKASIIVIQADPASAKSIERIVQLRAARPLVPIIVALQDADLAVTRSLIHQGVHDVVSIPFEFDQLSDAVFEASVKADKGLRPGAPLAPLYTVIGATGGCGATTIATHLTAELSRYDSATCCLLDLDVQFGAVAAYLGLTRQRSVADLFAAKGRLDTDLIEAVASVYRENIAVIAAPPDILPLEEIQIDQVLHVIECARQSYGTIVLDLPTNITNWSLSAMLDSSLVVLVVDLTVSALRQARRRLDLLTEMGFDRRNVRVVINRVERRLFKPIKSDDAEKALKAEVIASIANAPATVGAAQDQAMLVGEFDARSAFAKDIVKLGEALVSVEVGT